MTHTHSSRDLYLLQLAEFAQNGSIQELNNYAETYGLILKVKKNIPRYPPHHILDVPLHIALDKEGDLYKYIMIQYKKEIEIEYIRKPFYNFFYKYNY